MSNGAELDWPPGTSVSLFLLAALQITPAFSTQPAEPSSDSQLSAIGVPDFGHRAGPTATLAEPDTLLERPGRIALLTQETRVQCAY